LDIPLGEHPLEALAAEQMETLNQLAIIVLERIVWLGRAAVLIPCQDSGSEVEIH
jgi:hypothetical protein